MQVDTQNKEFQDALKLIQYTRQSVFLTGKAGTGKSTFLKYVCEITKKKHIVLAPTGIAAINAGGSTLHSFFKLPFYPLLPDDPNFSLKGGKLHSFLKYTSAHRKLIKEVELVIIDEISMVRADIIDFIDKILRVYSQNMREPFGGKQILLVGDVYQLEPVLKNDEREIINRFYPTPYFFSARVFNEIELVSIELTKVYRQTDKVFVNVLDHIRTNTAGAADLQLLNTRYNTQIKENESVMGSTAMTYDLSEEKLMKLKYKSQHGDSEASFRLYQYYCFTKNNIDKQLRFLERSASQGNVTAQFNYGVFLSDTNPTLSEYYNLNRAIYWMEFAVNNGNIDTKSKLQELKKLKRMDRRKNKENP